MYNPVKLKVQWVEIVPLADVSSSIDTELGVVLVYSTYFFLDISVFFVKKQFLKRHEKSIPNAVRVDTT